MLHNLPAYFYSIISTSEIKSITNRMLIKTQALGSKTIILIKYFGSQETLSLIFTVF